MNAFGRTALGVLSIGWSAPALAQGYDQNSLKTLEQQINEKCGGRRGAQRQDCANRIKDSYQRALARNGARRR